METIECTISERGNGFPDVGDFVAGDDGEIYRLVAYVGPIHTGQPGTGNYVYAQVEAADWSDVDEDWESQAAAVLGSDEDEA